MANTEIGDFYDVIVIGSGGAGLYAAITSAENNLKVLLMSKGKVNRSGATQLAGSGLAGDIETDGESLWNLEYEDADKSHTKKLGLRTLFSKDSI